MSEFTEIKRKAKAWRISGFTEVADDFDFLIKRVERLEKVREAALDLEPWLPNIRCGVAAKFSEHIKASNCLRDALKDCEVTDDNK